ncbi:thioesterase II family protein [Nocardia lijiangensis]|uniref:thioesterase II family protein n=1 Tax=Nocardia lijiangensis TaxID=299618 RepID=UPI0035A26063
MRYPHAGGSASAYASLARELAPGFEVVAVQYPGRQDRHREQLVDDVGILARAVVGALEPVLHRPIALFGHSTGALLLFETALILGAERQESRRSSVYLAEPRQSRNRRVSTP